MNKVKLKNVKNIESKTNSKDFNNRISSNEKEELLNFKVQEQGISKFNLLTAFCILLLVLSIIIPKIYLANNIYYVSRDISRLNSEKNLLDEEKIKLDKEIETINNKHLMLEIVGK
ncbi:hypothetical protein DCO58_01620 [Helicobacter saguini]|uniref:Cell division protein FtsL n=1 Tax=Helicobacter saguini TaxID=1548018 RepID=A0A347W1T3_9HELI|nr:hypothetical protein [Helicobacter saguini]MWV62919.1 hypothetical protein [Helicobacter saguini]MWV66411.1 hypothetical protein [Helicobacter saguini]MWV68762.1 hypothetical protein [Helicobacter saguini]MWV71684.1 hypothetical protein [Helicobacter saguini]TLD91868.1 hypothetical protein LS64_011130 [Helicobacter saguini]